MKILYYDWGSNSSKDICEAFNRLGIEYESFSYSIHNYETDDEFSKYVKHILSKKQFDCIFSFDYIPIIAYIAQECKMLYYSWIYDCPHNTLYSKSVYSKYNRIFFFDREQCKYFHARGVVNAFHMPLAVNVNKFNALLGENLKDAQYIHNISFIGSLYNDNLYNHIQYLPEYLRGYLEAVLQSQKKIYGYDLISDLLTENIINELDQYIVFGDDVMINIPNKQIYLDIFYKKLAELERKEVLQTCAEYTTVALYTGSKIDNISNNIISYPPVNYDTQLPELYRKSKINLNVTCRSIISGIPLRVLDIMASGGFLLSNYQQELAEYFVPGEDLVLYESMQDLRDKVNYYLKHEEERSEITYNGYKKVRERFSYDIALCKILEI